MIGENYSAQRKTCAIATLSAENLISLGSNTGLCNEANDTAWAMARKILPFTSLCKILPRHIIN